jgi:thiosulfate dehydrogenase (quinone) large subunit
VFPPGDAGGFVNNSVVVPETTSGQANKLKESKTFVGRVVQWDYTFAFWALRLWLGVRALFVGIQKFAAYKSVAMPLIDPSTGQPDASGVMVNASVKSYAMANYAGIPVALRDKFAHDPVFPKFALTLFDRMLGPAFILTGIMLIIGLGTRLSLIVQGLLFIALTVGLVLIDSNDGVAYLGIHIGLVAAAFLLAQHNRFAVIKRW